ncbi:unnamed protein product [Fusarium venenatum]|uniref:Uncharacterized protein n=1 Tax=Fusarium venenatum TaxID=56646 RepID=A0A2L2T967_9HYPO|nr:uncharacterized protein FVRRES_13419 [Fusarium venenatum]CEI41096.1 unnamed protein product [Fusarium venenatum]
MESVPSPDAGNRNGRDHRSGAKHWLPVLQPLEPRQAILVESLPLWEERGLAELSESQCALQLLTIQHLIFPSLLILCSITQQQLTHSPGHFIFRIAQHYARVSFQKSDGETSLSGRHESETESPIHGPCLVLCQVKAASTKMAGKYSAVGSFRTRLTVGLLAAFKGWSNGGELTPSRTSSDWPEYYFI